MSCSQRDQWCMALWSQGERRGDKGNEGERKGEGRRTVREREEKGGKERGCGGVGHRYRKREEERERARRTERWKILLFCSA